MGSLSLLFVLLMNHIPCKILGTKDLTANGHHILSKNIVPWIYYMWIFICCNTASTALLNLTADSLKFPVTN